MCDLRESEIESEDSERRSRAKTRGTPLWYDASGSFGSRSCCMACAACDPSFYLIGARLLPGNVVRVDVSTFVMRAYG